MWEEFKRELPSAVLNGVKLGVIIFIIAWVLATWLELDEPTVWNMLSVIGCAAVGSIAGMLVAVWIVEDE